ncbi:MAG TPA: cation diffusion facilitator family transporter [Spirochaetota bacterium]|nr:cation diffusion facilitator family transporter [Spirochaetota bacterium]HPC42629.1 cation diffusion facilitator family transporter [Spirochaetota bacterium]HPL17990.1 cation diffusion facilitator family transporter [Spirochaetota bacterium]HQF08451.1 cation diffusion facilitator family transporter [Spirochaetota bacterium]HQH99089.1 cation diffusion facilitator family transporter [Spirochaetota bacterium]
MKERADKHARGGHAHEGHDHHHHARGSRLVLVIMFNASIAVAEYIGGLLSGSLALISDAGHNFSDVLSLIMGYAGERVSEKRPDKKFTFGLKRFEVAVALVNALSLLAIGLYIVYEAVERYLNPVPIDLKVMVPVALIGLAGNLFSMLLLIRDRHRTLNMKAAFLHLLYDTVSSVAVIGAAVILYVTGQVLVDLAISLIIVAMIAGSSFSIIRDSMRIFLQGTPAHIDADEVYREIGGVHGVGSVHGLHIWSINSTEIFLSCHICASPAAGGSDTDGIIRNVNSMLEHKYGIRHTTLQVENSKICFDSGTCCR